jgi:hypothetical protein
LAGLEHLITSRGVLAGMLAAIGLAIVLGPEIRLAVARIRSVRSDARDDLAPSRARASAR